MYEVLFTLIRDYTLMLCLENLESIFGRVLLILTNHIEEYLVYLMDTLVNQVNLS